MQTHILITGASRGIGAAIAEALATDATKVVALSSADGDLADPDVPHSHALKLMSLLPADDAWHTE